MAAGGGGIRGVVAGGEIAGGGGKVVSDELIEILADIEHERWSKWMRYMFECGTFNEGGTWTMPADKVERWHRQVGTPYAELSDREKESDRDEVRTTLQALIKWLIDNHSERYRPPPAWLVADELRKLL
jgi:hypothetical protein